MIRKSSKSFRFERNFLCIQSLADEGLPFFQKLSGLFLGDETFGIELIHVFRSRRAGCDPAVIGRNLDAADSRIAVRRTGQDGRNGTAAQDFFGYILFRQGADLILFFKRRRCIAAHGKGPAQFVTESFIVS